MAQHPEIRIGNAERDEAVQALEQHFAAGQLDADEYEDRRGRARDAVTRADLAALFADLPVKDGSGKALARPKGLPKPGRRTDTGQRVAQAAVGLAPFVALALFFLTGSWLWFLLVPALGVVYGVVRDNDD